MDQAKKAIHMALTAVMLGLGGLLLLPGDTFHQSGSWRLFIEAGLSEPQVALAMFIVGMAGLLGFNPSSRWAGLSSTGTLATGHGALALMFFVGNQTAGAIVPYGVFAALGYRLLWLEWRA